jgi:hypothetical protein
MIDFLKNPFWWLPAIGAIAATAHALAKILDKTLTVQKNAFVPIVEVFIAIVLGYLAIATHYEGMLPGSVHREWHESPFAIMCLLCFFGLGSIWLYLKYTPSQRRR